MDLNELNFSNETKPLRFDRRIVFSLSILMAIVIYFWTSSRYPALDEKAALGGDNDIAAIAFDQIVKVSSSDSILSQIYGNAVNWAYTNKQGMLFGVFLAAAIMTLLQLFNKKQFKGGFANTLLGVTIGAPLGVCVNCAVPIAMGTQKSGARTETTLSILMSSPTLNMVVLGMTFAVFPFWLASLKIGLTLAFIVFAIPLAVRLFGPEHAPSEDGISRVMDEVKTAPALSPSQDKPDFIVNMNGGMGWIDSLIWVLKTSAKNLWYIVKLTVPLMILAGILGAIVITLAPWDYIADVLPTSGLFWFLSLVLISILGTFLPVPIAFDVVICAVLLTVGVDPAYVAALLITLGLFSIYPGLQIGHSISKRLAMGLFGMVALLGLMAGLGASALSDWEAQRQETAINVGLDRASQKSELQRRQDLFANDDVMKRIRPNIIGSGEIISTVQTDVEIRSWPFQIKEAVPLKEGQIFTSTYGPNIGVLEPDNVSPLRFMVPLERNRSIASGDVHGDGWPDIVLTSEAGLALYANVGGKEFMSQTITAPEISDSYVMRTALIDYDGDEDLDIIVGTFSDGVFSIENIDGQFKTGAQQIFKGQEGTATSAFAFGDLDRDGDLDIIIGNSAIGNNSVDRTISAAQNFVLFRDDDRWIERALLGADGETLSVLLTDMNADGWLDMFVGNDYNPPDQLWLSDGAGAFKPTPSDFIQDSTSRWTMSLASGDVDGDLIPEIYSGNISGRSQALPRDPEEQCRHETGRELQACLDYLQLIEPYHRARRAGNAVGCLSIQDPYFAEGCTLIALTSPIMTKGGTGAEAVGELCEKIPEKWDKIKKLCHVRRAEKLSLLTDDELEQTIVSDSNANVFFKKSSLGENYKDIAETWGVEDGGWTWNARFADLNHDESQDLYVVNGHSIARRRYQHKLFINKKDHFVDEAERAGIASGLAATSYSYVDIDRDGDLDIIMVPLTGQVKVFENASSQSDTANSIQFALRGKNANSHVIGAKIIIRYGDDVARAQIRELQASGGFASFDDPIIHFGLGAYEQIKSVEIIWPDGEESKLSVPLASGHRYEIRRQ